MMDGGRPNNPYNRRIQWRKASTSYFGPKISCLLECCTRFIRLYFRMYIYAPLPRNPECAPAVEYKTPISAVDILVKLPLVRATLIFDSIVSIQFSSPLRPTVHAVQSTEQTKPSDEEAGGRRRTSGRSRHHGHQPRCLRAQSRDGGRRLRGRIGTLFSRYYKGAIRTL